jgi:hypothetical protein
MEVIVLMSNAGRIVAVYDKIPSSDECDKDYAKYLGNSVPAGSARTNCWIERRQIKSASVHGQRFGKVHLPKEGN